MTVPTLGLPLIDHGDAYDDVGWSNSALVDGTAFQFLGNGNEYLSRTPREDMPVGTKVFYLVTLISISYGSIRFRAGNVSGVALTEPGQTHTGIVETANGQLIGVIESSGDGSDARFTVQAYQVTDE